MYLVQDTERDDKVEFLPIAHRQNVGKPADSGNMLVEGSIPTTRPQSSWGCRTAVPLRSGAHVCADGGLTPHSQQHSGTYNHRRWLARGRRRSQPAERRDRRGPQLVDALANPRG